MGLIGLIISVIIALMIGIVADKISPFGMPGGLLGAIFAGFVGTWVGYYLFGAWGPAIAGFSLIPALLGAFIVVFVIGLLAHLFD